jgi:hypothetical protein
VVEDALEEEAVSGRLDKLYGVNLHGQQDRGSKPLSTKAHHIAKPKITRAGVIRLTSQLLFSTIHISSIIADGE